MMTAWGRRESASGPSARLLAVLAVLVVGWPGAAVANYPIFSQRYAADPSPIVVDGRVYVFASHDGDDQTWWDMVDFTCISSDDLVNWTDHGEVFHAPSATTWATYAWAPAVVERDGRFYLYYTNARDGTGVAVAESVLGPYVDPLGDALYRTGNYSDPALLVDGGVTYLHLKDAVWSILNPDMVSLAAPPQGYARSSFPDYKEGGITHELAGRYNLSYVTNPLPGYGWSYAQCLSDAATTDYAYGGLWFWEPAAPGPNTHGELFAFAGRHYFVYHNGAVAQARGEGTGFQRSLAIDRLYLGADGALLPFTSTRDWMAPVRYLDPYSRVEAETMAAERGIETEACSAGGRNLKELAAGDWVALRGVDFGSGAVSLTASVASGDAGGTIELRLDAVDGRLAATAVVGNTGGWQQWTEVVVPVTGASGVHDVFIVFVGDAGALFNFDWWQVTGGVTSGRQPPTTLERSVCLRALGSPVPGDEVYLMHDNEDGTWSFEGVPDRTFLAVVDDASGAVGRQATRDVRARFHLYSNPDASYCLRAAANDRFLVASGLDVRATFDEGSAGSPRLLAGSAALFAIDDCVTGTAQDCALNTATVGTQPTSPPLTTGFGGPCRRVDPTIQEGRVAIARPGVVTGARFDRASPGTPGTLDLYQLGCGCDATLRLVRDPAADALVLAP